MFSRAFAASSLLIAVALLTDSCSPARPTSKEGQPFYTPSIVPSYTFTPEPPTSTIQPTLITVPTITPTVDVYDITNKAVIGTTTAMSPEDKLALRQEVGPKILDGLVTLGYLYNHPTGGTAVYFGGTLVIIDILKNNQSQCLLGTSMQHVFTNLAKDAVMPDKMTVASESYPLPDDRGINLNNYYIKDNPLNLLPHLSTDGISFFSICLPLSRDLQLIKPVGIDSFQSNYDFSDGGNLVVTAGYPRIISSVFEKHIFIDKGKPLGYDYTDEKLGLPKVNVLSATGNSGGVATDRKTKKIVALQAAVADAHTLVMLDISEDFPAEYEAFKQEASQKFSVK